MKDQMIPGFDAVRKTWEYRKAARVAVERENAMRMRAEMERHDEYVLHAIQQLARQGGKPNHVARAIGNRNWTQVKDWWDRALDFDPTRGNTGSMTKREV